MRDAFVRRLTDLALEDPRITLVVGDLGYGVVDDFAQQMPEQFVNAGVAEQAMIGIAAGLASRGRRVFVYSIANFPTLRCLEQIRNDICYHKRDVTVVSIGAGVAYGTHGYTHHAVEDLAALRALPGLTIISPADPAEARAAAEYSARVPGPHYVRLGKNGERALHSKVDGLDLTVPLQLRAGADVTLIATGAIAENCLRAADLLFAKHGIQSAVFSCPVVKPLNLEWLAGLDPSTPLITVEEHIREGGFGSLVLECANDHHPGLCVTRAGLNAAHSSRLGSQDHLRSISHLDPEGLVQTVLRAVDRQSAGPSQI
jgi:transketolase